MLRALWDRLRHDRRFRRLVVPPLLIALVSVVAAMVVHRSIRDAGTPREQAARLVEAGELEAADRAFVAALSTRPDFETLVAFIDNRARLAHLAGSSLVLSPEPASRAVAGVEMVERALSSGELTADERLMVRYWLAFRMGGTDAERIRVVALADRNPPARHANRLLARAAVLEGDLPAAAPRFEREGLSFPDEAERNLLVALEVWQKLEAWDEIRARIDDPRYRAVAGARFRVALAEHDRNWPVLLRWIWPASFDGVTAWPVGLAVLSGVLWFLIVAGLGRMSASERGRRPLYVAAFALGVLSVYPTLVVISLQEALLGLRETGELVPDLIYFVFGVGLREEACKLLLFLPLLPALLRRGSRLEALTCGALVGLGFAAEENVLYFQGSDASAALARFLTANLLHVSLTAIAGLAVYDAARSPHRSSEILNAALPMVVLLHGGYDFLLSSPQMGELSFLAMTLFVLIAQRFLREFTSLSTAVEQERVLRLFIASVTLICGATYVYATTLVGPLAGLSFVATGLLGVGIFAYMFVRELA